jgi:hypothetical protein
VYGVPTAFAIASDREQSASHLPSLVSAVVVTRMTGLGLGVRVGLGVGVGPIAGVGPVVGVGLGVEAEDVEIEPGASARTLVAGGFTDRLEGLRCSL